MKTPRWPFFSTTAWITLALCLGVRLALQPLKERPQSEYDLDSEAVTPFLVTEKYFIRDLPKSPAVLLMGSSRTRYNFVPAEMARELGLPADQVANLSVDAGGQWEALALLRRNPRLLENAKVVVFDYLPWSFNEKPMLTERFFKLATLPECLELEPARQKIKAVVNWAWPYKSLRRSLIAWMLMGEEARAGIDPLPKKIHYPAWMYEPEESVRKRLRANPELAPDAHAAWALGHFVYSKRLEGLYAQFFRMLEERRIKVIVHEGPFNPEFTRWIATHAEARRADEISFQKIEAMAAESNGDVQVLRWRAPREIGLPPEDIMDFGHYSREGAEIYTRAIAKVIRRDNPFAAPDKPADKRARS